MKKILKDIYDILPFKLQFYSFIRRLIRLPHPLHQYFYFKGVFSTKVGDKQFKMMNYGYQFHVENEFFWGGIKNGWEKVSVSLWIQLCENANVIFDIGANTGCFSLIAKSLKPNSIVHAFEPMEAIFQKLKLNNDLNKYDIQMHPVALSDFNGTATIYPTSQDHVYSVTVNKNLFSGVKVFEQTIQTIRLDNFIESNSITSIDLMKIDVETHEVNVLEGMGKYLRLFQPDMLIEIQTDEIGEKVEMMLQGLDYLFFNIDEVKGIRETKNLGKSDWLNYLVCHRSTAERLKLIG